MDPGLKLISLNIEGNKHLNRILPYLEAQQPDVVCIQELIESCIPDFERAVGPLRAFAPMLISKETPEDRVLGIGIFSRLPLKQTAAHYYIDHPLQHFDTTDFETKFNTARYALAVACVEKNSVSFTVGTTHLPVTHEGALTHFQQKAFNGLLEELKRYPSIVVCGDFNAPRGGELFSILSKIYTDNVPLAYTTSLDPNLHRAGPLPLMVDGMFSSPDLLVRNVEMYCGVSDHCALMGEVSKS